ncbi:MAG TPA: GNAT family N-acetyltransferase, partial [Chroococcales cyanobacterium]
MIRPALYRDLLFLRRSFPSSFNDYQQRLGLKRPFASVFSWLPNPARFLLAEEDGRIKGFLASSPGNRSHTRWHIDALAVSTPCSFPSIGGELLDFLLFSHAGVKSYTLEADPTQLPLVELCQERGFRRYGTVHYYRLEPPLQGGAPPPAGIRPYHPRDAAALFDLHNACTPASVRMVDSWTAADFQVGFVERSMTSLRRRLGHGHEERFVVYRGEHLVGYLKSSEHASLPRALHVMAHPGFESLYEELIRFGLGRMEACHPGTVIGWAPDYQGAKKEAFESIGFRGIASGWLFVRDSTMTIKMAPGTHVALEDPPLRPADCDPATP